MRLHVRAGFAALSFAALAACASAGETAEAAAPAPYDAALAEKLGADEYGMRSYVLAILKTGPQDSVITDKDERAALFAGHFSNMGKLAEEGKLVLAGPLGGEPDDEALDYMAAPLETKLEAVFRCAWRDTKACKGLCDLLEVSPEQLREYAARENAKEGT